MLTNFNIDRSILFIYRRVVVRSDAEQCLGIKLIRRYHGRRVLLAKSSRIVLFIRRRIKKRRFRWETKNTYLDSTARLATWMNEHRALITASDYQILNYKRA